MTQIKLSKQAVQQLSAIRLESEAEQEITIDDSTATGNVWFALGDDGFNVNYKFFAFIDINREPGEKWGRYIYSHPYAEINAVSGLIASFVEAFDEDGNQYDLFDFSVEQRNRFVKIIEDFILNAEVAADDHYNHYPDVA